MEVKIKNSYTDEIIISGDYESIKIACEENRANLRRANLGGADLRGAENYSQDHEVFIEICNRNRDVFTEKDWAMIGVISVCRICWGEIKKRFKHNIKRVFRKLSEAGFDEWEKYYDKYTEQVKEK